MGGIVNRSDFQQLAELRLADSKALLDQRHWSGAYYIGGYAVECALKACIAKQTEQYDFPDKQAAKYYTHDLAELLRHAGLTQRLNEAGKNSELGVNWSVIKDWSESNRYEFRDDEEMEKHAKEFYFAVSDTENGLLKWIQKYW